MGDMLIYISKKPKTNSEYYLYLLPLVRATGSTIFDHVMSPLQGSQGLNARRARRTKSSRPKGPKAVGHGSVQGASWGRPDKKSGPRVFLDF